MERYQPDQYGRMMPDAHGQWVSLRAAELTALDAAQKSSADAQATIAALQARVQELERDPYKQGFIDALEKVASDWASKEFRGHDEIQSCEVQAFLDTRHVHYEECRGVKPLQSQLTQRTAELEAANKLLYRKNCELGRFETMISDLQAELERVRGELVGAAHNVNVYQSLYSTSCMDRALLENELRELRTLITALPKVEGAVVVSNGYVKDSTRCHALFGADEDAASYAALLQHRQGMEG